MTSLVELADNIFDRLEEQGFVRGEENRIWEDMRTLKTTLRGVSLQFSGVKGVE